MGVILFWRPPEVASSAQSRALAILTQPTAAIAPSWELTPTFNDGDIFSASGHGNALADAINYLLALYHTHNCVWTGRAWSDGDWGVDSSQWALIWWGQIRKDADSLEYGVEITPDTVMDSEIRISYASLSTTISVTGGGATSTQTGTLDISSLQSAEFYEVRVEARNLSAGVPQVGRAGTDVRVLYMREVDPQSYTTPHTFASGTTPTAADWQLLSTQASTVYDQLQAPRAPVVGAIRHVNNATATVWRGTITHLNRYLYYDLRLRPAHNSGTLSASIVVNGTTVQTVSVDDSDRFRQPDPQEPDGEVDYTRFYGAVDLSALALTEVTDYKIEVMATHSGIDDMFTEVQVLLLHEQQASSPTFTGWSVMPIFWRGDTVDGAGSMQTLRDNIVWLTDRVAYRNWAVHRRFDRHPVAMPPVWMVRYHRWLHYRWEPSDPDSDPAPEIGYLHQAKWQTVSLPAEANKWLAVDLSTFVGLFVGTRYRVAHVAYALEAADA